MVVAASWPNQNQKIHEKSKTFLPVIGWLMADCMDQTPLNGTGKFSSAATLWNFNN